MQLRKRTVVTAAVGAIVGFGAAWGGFSLAEREQSICVDGSLRDAAPRGAHGLTALRRDLEEACERLALLGNDSPTEFAVRREVNCIRSRRSELNCGSLVNSLLGDCL